MKTAFSSAYYVLYCPKAAQVSEWKIVGFCIGCVKIRNFSHFLHHIVVTFKCQRHVMKYPFHCAWSDLHYILAQLRAICDFKARWNKLNGWHIKCQEWVFDHTCEGRRTKGECHASPCFNDVSWSLHLLYNVSIYSYNVSRKQSLPRNLLSKMHIPCLPLNHRTRCIWECSKF